ncbi:hypothetical protein A0H76_1162 [Hepatospora eriocheir]|uniref:Uncharacterized protein n=1 Tax=Hepatospora eriocheir TaxID=1081669 RepID=A0A1X0QHK1_9MICR|nr:hypothetical protein A0H76_1162 [Hepatospora eriocheir]
MTSEGAIRSSKNPNNCVPCSEYYNKRDKRVSVDGHYSNCSASCDMMSKFVAYNTFPEQRKITKNRLLVKNKKEKKVNTDESSSDSGSDESKGSESNE